jgi:hypothetical protein
MPHTCFESNLEWKGMTRVLGTLLVSLMLTLPLPLKSAQAKVHMSVGRAKAIRECNALVSGMRQRTWGKTEFTRYRACMAQRGQGE